MHISELITMLQTLEENHGDLVVYDSDDFPIEEVEFVESKDTFIDSTFTIFSEGDFH